MRLWTIQTGEPLPIDESSSRLWRTSFIDHLAARRGWSVVRWASDFIHATKEFRGKADSEQMTDDGVEIVCLKSIGYKSNLSLRRLLEHRVMGREFLKRARDRPAPDVILASYPTIELCGAALRFATDVGCPVVIDVRDQWPDLYWEMAPRWARWAAKLAAWPLVLEARSVLRAADVLTANADGALRWALAHAGRDGGELDQAFPMAYPEPEPISLESLRDSAGFWAARGVKLSSGRPLVVYAGAVGLTGDFRTVAEAAKLLSDGQEGPLFVVCGGGDSVDPMKELAAGIPNLLVTGWVDSRHIRALLRHAFVGLVPYIQSPNFEGGITNKPIEYLAHGVPIATTLASGEFHRLLLDEDCGLCYSVGDAHTLSKIVKSLVAAPERHRGMAERARELYARRFRAEEVYGRMLDLIVRAAGKEGRS